MTHPYTITRRELTPEMLAANDPPSIEVRRALWAALLAASDKPKKVLTDRERSDAIWRAAQRWGHATDGLPIDDYIADEVEAAILAKLA